MKVISMHIGSFDDSYALFLGALLDLSGEKILTDTYKVDMAYIRIQPH